MVLKSTISNFMNEPKESYQNHTKIHPEQLFWSILTEFTPKKYGKMIKTFFEILPKTSPTIFLN